MPRETPWLALAAVVALLPACGHRPGSAVHLSSGSLDVRDGVVAIAGASGTEAHVSADGRLDIDGREVPLSAAQRDQLVAYYGAAVAVRHDAVATGAAGAAVGATAASEVVAGLAKGDMSGVGAKIEAKAGDVKRAAQKLCDDLGAVRAAQQALVPGLAAFGPYAIVAESDVDHCAREVRPQPRA